MAELLKDARCEMCDATPISDHHNPCCSSHEASLCCRCYRVTHFVETGPCH